MKLKRRYLMVVLVAVVLFGLCSLVLQPLQSVEGDPIAVKDQHGDPQRTGANLSETILTPANVNSTQFGKLWSKNLDGQVYAQPLYLPGQNIGGKTRNVVYAATMHNTVYAFDADDGTANALWSKNLGVSVPLASSQEIGNSCGTYRDIAGEIGILGTPVISQPKNAIYVVTMTKDGNGYHHQLHALDLLTGNELFGGPTTITASVPGTGDGSVGGTVAWNSQKQNARVSLSHQNGRIYLASAGYCDTPPYHGWVLGYNDTTLAQEVVYNATPNGSDGGIWQASQGISFDTAGNMYFMTGNGTVNETNTSARGESFIKMNKDGQILDWFTPYNYVDLNNGDQDLGSSGVLLIPGTNLVLGGGKQGKFYLLNTNNMGHYQAGNDNQVVQSFQAIGAGSGVPAGTHHVHGSPVYWQGPKGKWIYVWGENDFARAFNFNGTTLDTMPVSKSTFTDPHGMPGGFMTISANGATNGILWVNVPYSGDANQATVEGVLRAFDANDLTKELWNSKQNDSRDHLGNFAKFTSPTVVNGKVYMGTFGTQASFSGTLNVYGLLPAQNQQLFFNDFNDGNLSAWTPSGGTWASCQPTGLTKKYCKTDTLDGYSLAGQSSWTNYSVQSSVNLADDTGFLGVLGRATDLNHWYQLSLRKNTAGTKQWQILVKNGGTSVVIASGDLNYAANTYYTLKLDLNGSTIGAYQSLDNGANWTLLGSATDTTLTSGGIGLKATNSSAIFDDVKVISH